MNNLKGICRICGRITWNSKSGLCRIHYKTEIKKFFENPMENKMDNNLDDLTNNYSVMLIKDRDAKLTVKQLAEALYEGTPHLDNLAEKLARQHGKAGALTFFEMMGEDVQNFWIGIAQQLIDHAKEWEDNHGSACCLSKKEMERLAQLPRHPEIITTRRIKMGEENLKEALNRLREETQKTADSVKSLMQHSHFDNETQVGEDRSEMKANIMLSYRHLEDARMRLGKIIQALEGGVSIYDKK